MAAIVVLLAAALVLPAGADAGNDPAQNLLVRETREIEVGGAGPVAALGLPVGIERSDGRPTVLRELLLWGGDGDAAGEWQLSLRRGSTILFDAAVTLAPAKWTRVTVPHPIPLQCASSWPCEVLLRPTADVRAKFTVVLPDSQHMFFQYPRSWPWPGPMLVRARVKTYAAGSNVGLPGAEEAPLLLVLDEPDGEADAACAERNLVIGNPWVARVDVAVPQAGRVSQHVDLANVVSAHDAALRWIAPLLPGGDGGRLLVGFEETPDERRLLWRAASLQLLPALEFPSPDNRRGRIQLQPLQGALVWRGNTSRAPDACHAAARATYLGAASVRLEGAPASDPGLDLAIPAAAGCVGPLELAYPDLDFDGYGDETAARPMRCDLPPGWVRKGGDCDDLDRAVGPTALEICDGRDNDCDGRTDAEDPELVLAPCEALGVCSGRTRRAELCRAGRWDACGQPEIGPSFQQVETRCDGLDNDCDGAIDEWKDPVNCPMQRGVCRGAKSSRCEHGSLVCVAGDYGPDYEEEETRCDFLDNDCDGELDEGCPDPAPASSCGGCSNVRGGEHAWLTGLALLSLCVLRPRRQAR
ncbi:MAG: putative metal-binding motif-containing protein [Myxococcales bacterium]